MTAPAIKPALVAYQELQDAYDFFNTRLFDNELPDMLITLQRGKNTFGYFARERFTGKSKLSEIAMNPSYFGARSLCDTLSTLVHEMCHAWRFHCVDKPCRGGYHDKLWGQKMEAVGLMPSHTGRAGGKKTGQKVSHYIIPDGLFQDAVYELLKSGYEISWYDSYGSHDFVETRTDYTILSKWIANSGDDEKLVERLTSTVCKTNPLSKIDASNRTESAALASAIASVMVAPAAKGKSNRCKYTCTSCGLNAWAKPDVRIGCADCGILLMEQS